MLVLLAFVSLAVPPHSSAVDSSLCTSTHADTHAHRMRITETCICFDCADTPSFSCINHCTAFASEPFVRGLFDRYVRLRCAPPFFVRLSHTNRVRLRPTTAVQIWAYYQWKRCAAQQVNTRLNGCHSILALFALNRVQLLTIQSWWNGHAVAVVVTCVIQITALTRNSWQTNRQAEKYPVDTFLFSVLANYNFGVFPPGVLLLLLEYRECKQFHHIDRVLLHAPGYFDVSFDTITNRSEMCSGFFFTVGCANVNRWCECSAHKCLCLCLHWVKLWMWISPRRWLHRTQFNRNSAQLSRTVKNSTRSLICTFVWYLEYAGLAELCRFSVPFKCVCELLLQFGIGSVHLEITKQVLIVGWHCGRMSCRECARFAS